MASRRETPPTVPTAAMNHRVRFGTPSTPAASQSTRPAKRFRPGGHDTSVASPAVPQTAPHTRTMAFMDSPPSSDARARAEHLTTSRHSSGSAPVAPMAPMAPMAHMEAPIEDTVVANVHVAVEENVPSTPSASLFGSLGSKIAGVFKGHPKDVDAPASPSRNIVAGQKRSIDEVEGSPVAEAVNGDAEPGNDTAVEVDGQLQNMIQDAIHDTVQAAGLAENQESVGPPADRERSLSLGNAVQASVSVEVEMEETATPAPKEAVPKRATPRTATPKVATPKTATPKKLAAREITPKVASPKKTAPKQTASKQAAAKQATPKKDAVEATPKEVAPREATPEAASSNIPTPKAATPKAAAPKKTPTTAARRGRKAAQSAEAPTEPEPEQAAAPEPKTASARKANHRRSAAAPVNGAEEPSDADAETGEFEIERIVAHRPNAEDQSLLDVHVSWKTTDPAGELTWEPEANVQEDAPEVLFRYWRSVKGGRASALEDPDLWHVLRVEGHKVAKGKVLMHVAWIGSAQRSWEPEEAVADYAKEHLETYWAGKGGRESVLGEDAPAEVKKRGRPPKAASADAKAGKKTETAKAPAKAPSKAASKATGKATATRGKAAPAADKKKAAAVPALSTRSSRRK